MKGIVLGLVLIPVIFYTFNGVFGKSPDWLNISIFFISAAFSYIYEVRLFKSNITQCKTEKWAVIFLCIIAIHFAVFTFYPPRIGIFQDPLTGGYGIIE